MTIERGQQPNYQRIDNAISAHRALWAKTDQLANMLALAATAKCFIVIEGDTADPPLQITSDQATALIQAAIDATASDTATLGDELAAAAATLPQT